MAARRPLADVNEVSDYLKVPVQTLYGWRRRKMGPRASRVGRHLRYRWEDLDRWLDDQASIGVEVD